MSDASMQTAHEYARQYISHGWPVMILAADSSRGKIPPGNCPKCVFSETVPRHDMATCDHLLCHSFHAATLDPTRLAKMMVTAQSDALGIRTGRVSRLLVIDAESHARPDEPTGLDVLDQWEQWTNGQAGDLPPTLTARSVSDGAHLFYSLPLGAPRLSSGRILMGVDVKCEDSYVGAVNGDGHREWVRGGIVEAPPELISWLARSKRRVIRGGAGGQVVGDTYDCWKFEREGCPDGYRDHFINDLAFRLRKNNISRALYETRIFNAWCKVAQPPNARYEMPWEDAASKMNRVWYDVEPDPTHTHATALLERWNAARKGSMRSTPQSRNSVVKPF